MQLARTTLVLSAMVAVLPAFATAQSTTPASGTVAITNVSVIPMDRERVLPRHTVVVSGGRITAVGPSDRVRPPTGATVIDGSGKFLIPGLAEMHAHIPPGNAPQDVVERVLSLFVLNGVTTARGMLGDPRHLPLRERVERGEILGPRIVTSGPSFNGNSASSTDVGRQMVLDQKAAGYDFLKIHPGIRREVFDAIAATAKRVGIPFAGHVPLDVGLHRALEVRYATIDHIDGFVEASLREGATKTPSQSQFFGLNLADQVDESRIPVLARAVKESGVAIVPTQGFLVAHVGLVPADSLLKRPEMAYWLESQLNAWASQKRTMDADANFTPEMRRRFLDVRNRAIKALHDAGAMLLLGSDAPQLWDVPGFSIHRELAYMVEAGLTPYQALQTGTMNVARFFGWEARAGSIAEGKNADLVLLDANPLENIGNASRISGVMVRGAWLGPEERARRLAALKR